MQEQVPMAFPFFVKSVNLPEYRQPTGAGLLCWQMWIMMVGKTSSSRMDTCAISLAWIFSNTQWKKREVKQRLRGKNLTSRNWSARCLLRKPVITFSAITVTILFRITPEHG